ncbi:MAG: XrtA/PEP-CTERM system-associated ATPase [Burkholderiales bacterium]
MYESHFGLSGPPFQLNPDPAFYFNSRGHGHALAYLRYGVAQGEGFIVVTGEIGAGKTTLLRALLDELDRAQVVAAQIVSTQLESGDLLQAIITGFGIPTNGIGKASMIATLEAFLMTLATQGRRALLVIDEAQNLEIRAIEELRMLSNFQLGTQSLLQSFLVGQPELRKKLESPEMEQLRQRVTASCHLGPLGFEETRGYVEHRLRHVGWQGRPHFDEQAFDQIYRWTGGVPRRINRLCNRLLLATFLEEKEAISGAMVEATAQELRHEIGEGSFEPVALPESRLASLANTPEVPDDVAAKAAVFGEPAHAVTETAVVPVLMELDEPLVDHRAVDGQDRGQGLEQVPAPMSIEATDSMMPAPPQPASQVGEVAEPVRPMAQQASEVDQLAVSEPAALVMAAADDAEPAPTQPFEAAVPAAQDEGVAAASPELQSVEALQTHETEADAPVALLPADPIDAGGAQAQTIADAEVADLPLAKTPVVVAQTQPVASGEVLRGGSEATAERSVVRAQGLMLKPRSGVLLCLADSALSALKLAAIAKAMDDLPSSPRLVLVNPGAQAQTWPWEEMESLLPAPEVAWHLGVAPGSVEVSAQRLFERLALAIDEFSPQGVVTIGSSEALLACSLMVYKRGLPILRLEAGERSAAGGEAVNSTLIEQLAEVLFSRTNQAAHQQLYRSGIAPERVYGVPGRLAVDVVNAVLPSLTTPYGAFLRHRLPIFLGPRWSSEVDGTAYAVLTRQLGAGYSQHVAGLLDVLVDQHTVPKLLWLADADTRAAIQQWQAATPSRADQVFVIEESLPRSALDRRNSARVLCSDIRSLPDQLSVLRGAVAVLTEPGHVLADAACLLGIPAMALDAGRLTLDLPSGADRVDQPWGSVALNDFLAQCLSRGEPSPPGDLLPEVSQAALVIAARLNAWCARRLQGPRPAARAAAAFRRTAHHDPSSDWVSVAA